MARLLSTCLRALALFGKFLLIFFLARMLPPAELGTYGLITATVAYAGFFLGLDFYTYSGRAMLRAPRSNWPNMVRDQFAVFACSYLVIVPLLGALFVAGLLPAEYLGLFYALMALEHLSQELTRLLITVGRPLAASACLFLRTGAWSYLVVAAYWGGFGTMSLDIVLAVWVVADAMAVGAAVFLVREWPWEKLTRRIDWRWIASGLRTAMLFLAGTLALRALFAVDRYFVEVFSGRELLGVYTLYFGICNSLIAFVDAAIFSFRYPPMVTLYRTGSIGEFDAARRDFRRQTLLATSTLVIVVAVLVVPVLGWIGKPLYLEHLQAFYVLLLASALYVAGHIPHFALYAMGRDRSIVAAHIGGFVLFVALGALLGPQLKLGGVAIALLAAIAFVGAFKQWEFAAARRDRLMNP